MTLRQLVNLLLCTAAVTLLGCNSRSAVKPGQFVQRAGDEIIVCGQLVHTGAPVVTWMDPGGYDAYRVERRFAPIDESDWQASTRAVKDMKTPNRYGLRKGGLTPEQIEQVRGGGWTLPLLQSQVDQFVIHYDDCGTSRQCFKVLQDRRDLSVHFLLDLDGTIYQTLDLKERAWHATTSNDRSIGVEIANVGAYELGEGDAVLATWYQRGADGRTRIVVPESLGGGQWLRTPNFIARPDRDQLIVGRIQGQDLRMYDYTPQQYDSLIKLTAAVCTVFPRIRCDYPRDGSGRLILSKLPDDRLAAYHGILGHFHIQTDKTDPGPALQWDRVIDGARALMARK